MKTIRKLIKSLKKHTLKYKSDTDMNLKNITCY